MATIAADITSAREFTLDLLRGVAIALMVLDHAVLVFGGPILIHDTVTRLAMPLFMVIAGRFWQGRVSTRLLDVAIAAALASILQQALGLMPLNILYVYLAAYLLMFVAVRAPLPAAVLAYVQQAYFPIFPEAYQVGAVLLLMLLGHYLHLPRLDRLLHNLPALGLAAIGRAPLTWYVGHLLAIAVVLYALPA